MAFEAGLLRVIDQVEREQESGGDTISTGPPLGLGHDDAPLEREPLPLFPQTPGNGLWSDGPQGFGQQGGGWPRSSSLFECIGVTRPGSTGLLSGLDRNALAPGILQSNAPEVWSPIDDPAPRGNLFLRSLFGPVSSEGDSGWGGGSRNILDPGMYRGGLLGLYARAPVSDGVSMQQLAAPGEAGETPSGGPNGGPGSGPDGWDGQATAPEAPPYGAQPPQAGGWPGQQGGDDAARAEALGRVAANKALWEKLKGYEKYTPEERGQSRVDFAYKQLQENPEAWKADDSLPWRVYYKCNEFVGDACTAGDPLGWQYPQVDRSGGLLDQLTRSENYHHPMVKDLADPNFNPERLEYISNEKDARAGDIVVWYDGNGVHHTGIYAGDGHVVSAAKDSLTETRMADTFSSVRPIFRRPR